MSREEILAKIDEIYHLNFKSNSIRKHIEALRCNEKYIFDNFPELSTILNENSTIRARIIQNLVNGLNILDTKIANEIIELHILSDRRF